MADRRLQVFHAVARYQSFTRAAESLLMSQPAVTFQVRQLEAEYQVRLIERNRNRIALTPAGELVRDYAEKILNLSSELDSRLAELLGEVQGNLQVGVSSSLGAGLLSILLADFNSLYPQVSLRLIAGNSEQIGAQVAAHTLDVALTTASQLPHGVQHDCCAEETLHIVCAPDYPLAEQRSVTPADLLDYEFLSREPGSGLREATDQWFRDAGVDPTHLKTLMEVGKPDTLRALLLQGLGFAVLPAGEVTTLLAGNKTQAAKLCAVPLKSGKNTPALKRPIYLLHPRDQFASHLVSTFSRFARQKLAELVQ